MPLLVLGLLLLVPLLVRRILPAIGSWIVVPLFVAAGATVGLVILAVQVLAVLPWRAARAHPPVALYALGDVTVTGLTHLRRLREGLYGILNRLYRLRLRYLLVIIAVLVWRWNGTYCDRAADAENSCRSPYSVAQVGVTSAWTDFWAGL
jgi:hypothetical protein